MDESPVLLELIEQRRQALLRRWAKGDRLKESEMAEIDDLLPAATDDESDVAVPSRKEKKTEDGYRRKIAEYAEIYSTHPRTVKTWIGKGRHAKDGPDFPPLDDPVMMPLWWPRHHKWRVPDNLLELAAAAERAEVEAAAAETADFPPRQIELLDGSGFAAEIERVRTAAQRAATALDDAEARGNAAEIDLATRRYERATKQLREYERDAVKVLEAQGHLVAVDVLEPILREAHVAVETRLRAMLNKVDPLLQQEPDLQRRRKIWSDHLDAVFEDLHRLQWRRVETEEEAP